MEPKPITPATLPPYLSRNTASHLPVESPRFIQPNLIYVRSESGALFINTTDKYYPITINPDTLQDRVGIMSTCITDPETEELVAGFVADLRWIDSDEDMSQAADVEAPADQEFFGGWKNKREQEIPIAALTYRAVGTYESLVSGDVRFAKAAIHLAYLADWFEAERINKEFDLNNTSKRSNGHRKLL